MRLAFLTLLLGALCIGSAVFAQPARFDPIFPIGTGLNNSVSAMALQANGQVLLGGSFTTYQGVAAPRLLRMAPNGQRDTSFQPGSGADARINVMRVLPDGKILIGGLFFLYNNQTARGLARLLPNGAFDTSFVLGQGFNNEVLAMAPLSDGGVLVGGFFSQFQQQAVSQPVKLLANGQRDLSFNVGGLGSTGLIEVMHALPDGRVLVAGSVTQYNGQPVGRIFRLLSNGTRDTTFQTGSGIAGGNVRYLAVQPDGKIVVVGSFTSYNGVARNRLLRLQPDGALDTTFVPNVNFTSTIVQLTILPDGKILVFGNHNIPNQQLQHLALVDAQGQLVTGGGSCSELNGGVNAAVLLPDSSLIVGGNFSMAGGIPMARVARVVTNTSGQSAGLAQLTATQQLICPGTQLFLSANGSLNGSQYWEWFAGGCAQNPVALGGAFISVTPLVTTTYYARGAGNCLPEGPCDSITIYVDTLAPVPLQTSLPPLSVSCGGNVPLPQASDNCSGTITGVADRFLPETRPGSYTLLWTYTDNSGNITQQSQLLTVDTVDSRLMIQGQQFQALNSQASYRWLRCDQQFAPVAGATASNFTPTNSGTYAVEVRQNGCVDTSVCLNVVVSSVGHWPEHWKVYPNPATQWLQAQLPVGSRLHLYDLQGRLLQQWLLESGHERLTLPSLPSGLYVLQLSSNEGVFSQRLRVE